MRPCSKSSLYNGAPQNYLALVYASSSPDDVSSSAVCAVSTATHVHPPPHRPHTMSVIVNISSFQLTMLHVYLFIVEHFSRYHAASYGVIRRHVLICSLPFSVILQSHLYFSLFLPFFPSFLLPRLSSFSLFISTFPSYLFPFFFFLKFFCFFFLHFFPFYSFNFFCLYFFGLFIAFLSLSLFTILISLIYLFLPFGIKSYSSLLLPLCASFYLLLVRYLWFIIRSVYDALSAAEIVRMSANGDLGRVQEERIVAYLNVLYRYSPEWTDENHEISEVDQLLF